MGQSDSTLADTSTSITSAYHVLRVSEKSPAALVGIEPFFDFLCGVNGVQIGQGIDGLTQLLEHNENRQIILQIWSTKRKELRDVSVVPSRAWSLPTASSPNGQLESTPSLLGLSLRLCNPQLALDQVWHVLEILSGSPAESAGLVPFGDYIIGYSNGVLRGEGDFYDVVEASVDRPLRLYVYNADYDITREAVLIPNREWGGEGLLGCGVGYGLLHRIPRPQDRVGGTLQAEEIPVEEDDRFANTTPSPSTHVGINGFKLPKLTSRERGVVDGYEEVAYDGFSASEGVEIVPKEESDFDTFTPADAKHTPTPIAMGYGAGRGFGSGGSGGYASRPAGPPRSLSSGPASSNNAGAIGEEDEEEMV